MVNEFSGPQSLEEFEERLSEMFYYLRGQFFSVTYEIASTKTLKREKNNETLVEAMCNFEKYCKEKLDESLFQEKPQIYEFLKLALEKDAPFYSEYHLGVGRDRSGLSLPQKNKIAVQIAAQVIWHLEKNKVETIEKMTTMLLNKKNPIHVLFQLNRFCSRTIRDWISDVFPVPNNSRNGRPSNEGVQESIFKNLTPIPEVFLEYGNMINFPKLRFAIISLTQVLKTLGWTVDQIKQSIFFQLYQGPLKFYPRQYALDWIDETIIENGSIFDS